MAENAEKLVVFWHFPSNALQSTKHHRREPDTKEHAKHHKMTSKPNMKPQTQREKPASQSCMTLGPTNSRQCHPTRNTPDMKQRHRLRQFSAATTVKSESLGCPCHVQPRCCIMWGLVSQGVCGPLKYDPGSQRDDPGLQRETKRHGTRAALAAAAARCVCVCATTAARTWRQSVQRALSQ